jgi:hypothetical protein
VLEGTVDVPPAPPVPLQAVRVRVKPGGPKRRLRAGLGPFGVEPVEVDVSPEQRAALQADAWLDVMEI